MKIRHGFVSNSSSSSFIVAIDHKPVDANDLMGMLFPNMSEDSLHEYDLWDRTESHTIKEISEAVFNDLSTDASKIADAFNGWIQGAPDCDDFRKADGMIDWDRYQIESDKYQEQYAKDVISKYKGKFVFTVTYADEDGSFGCFMEHSDIFENVSHERISKH